MAGSKTVRIVEVGPRDGLQNIKTVVDTSTKLELIQRLQDAGLQNVEITSVVSPKAIPQLADCRKILSAPVVKRWQQTNGTLRMPVLVPNTKGLRIALEHGVREVAVFVSATEGFSRANINCTVDESLERAKQVASVASAAGVLVRGYVSCIFADPFDGPTPLPAVSRAVRSLLDMGCYEVSLGDTLGVGTPPDVRRLLEYLKAQNIHTERLAGHFHDTYGQALANVWTAYECGLRTFDSSVGGLGGCPFAPGAKGNVATEDVVYLFQQAGVDTGVDLQQVVDTGVWISQALAKPNDSRAGAALASKSKISSTKSSKITDRPKEALEWSILEQSDNVVVRRAGANGNIVLNKPRNGNTLTFPMISEIIQAFKSFESDASISRVLISANGKFFCTGMDLSQAAQAVGRGGDASSKLFQALTDLFELIDNSPKVTVACIQGPAFGGGIGLAFSCDIRISISSASFTLSEAKLGMLFKTMMEPGSDAVHGIAEFQQKPQLSDRESQEFSSAAFNEANLPMEDHNTVEEQPQFQSNEQEDVLGVPGLVNQSSPNMSTTWRSGSSQSQSNAIEAYAREAWLSVLGDHMTVEDSCNLEVAQATNILAIIDFTAGRTSSAWLKIGMAIRIAQDLQLMKEPSETLPLVEQEERRRSFWSIYLLDKLVSLGKHRHFAILDEDCHVRLPCDELTFRSGGWGQNVTLRQLLDWSTDVGVESGFPVAILASSVLARCTRRLLHDRNTDETPPWDSKSEFASITSLLLLVESRLQVDQHPIRNVVDTYRLDDGVIDHPAMGHVIFARTVFHVCYCLLYHPFLVREQVRRVKCQVPSSFMRLASQKSYEHARDLVNLLHDAEAVGCHLGASFYAYSACLAGSILSLHMHTEKDTESQRHLELLSATQDSISILEGMAKFWDHASKIHHRLLTFNANAYLFDSLLDTQLKSVMDPGWERSLWSMVDYGEMCRESNLSIPSPKIPAPSDSPSFPDLELESEQMLDLGLGVQQISQIDDNLMNFDTPNIKYLLELASGGG
ncbi:3-hydroxymethyl-3-methylglutaryl-CoA lyase [Colletotrichum paranaense]|uniref:hydroxymethylglutaryl-CoA lyase n=1 Tax=Colletotrichum paranaense TaxID=1914294 RepID=A0ABQ9T780_9PEZI|nr:3-hydroxymethyl-3-methylglutaryl-CoA lyase [Colletotrichum paranaense]KAK1547207.1 3-hydroxymethyl-3-methylglutaryl-CoA lyase [Colletotrichum paranaense]